MAEFELEQKPSEYYDAFLADRKAYEDRAEEFASLTIPALFREDGSTGADALPTNYSQSLLAKLVKNLSSKITLTLLPPSASGFKLYVDDKTQKEITGNNAQMKQKIAQELNSGTNLINKEIEKQDIRRYVFGLVDQQLVIGTCIMEKVPKKGIKVHGLRNIAFTLNDVGEATQMCVVETMKRLPKSLMEFEVEDKKDDYKLYTMVIQDIATEKWTMVQELDGNIIGSPKTFTDKNVPFSYQGMIWNIGEKAHRPFVEDYYGSMNAYNDLSKVLHEGSMIASKSLTFVDERLGRTRKKDVADSKNGAVIDGRAEDVSSYQHNKNFDFQTAQQVRAEYRQELEEAFLAKNTITRQAERVTAEEIRQMAQELETAMAGVYATISNRITKRIVTWVMEELGLKFNAIDVAIITGLNALGMNNEIVKLDGFLTRVNQLGYTDYIIEGETISRYAEGYGVVTEGLIRSQDEVQAMQQQRQEQLAMQQMREEGAKTAGKTGVEKMLNGGQQ